MGVAVSQQIFLYKYSIDNTWLGLEIVNLCFKGFLHTPIILKRIKERYYYYDGNNLT